ncbi:MAG: leucine-rich repeat domain-containing protein [Promethearchaeota archaeon]
MREPLLPIAIDHAFQTGELSKEKASALLTSLIESSNDAQIRSQSIEILDKLGLIDSEIFKVLENSLVSDENAIVRASALKQIILNFTNKSLALLEWVVDHDRSPIVLKVLYENVENSRDHRFKILKQKLANWNMQFSEMLCIVPKEVKFFLDLEALFAQNKRNYTIDPNSYKYFQQLSDTKDSEPWLLIRNKHVEILNFNYYNWNFVKQNQDIIDSFLKLGFLDVYLDSINKYKVDGNLIQEIPESIGRFTYLKILILKGNKIIKIPESIGELTSLKELNLSHNKIQTIPLSIRSLENLEKLNLKHNNILKIPDTLNSFLNSLKYFKY